jgi:hypothetical protein
MADELDCRQRLVIGEYGFTRRELYEVGFEGVEWNFLLNGEDLLYALPAAPRFFRSRLSNTLMQPPRTASAGHPVDERRCQLVLENPCPARNSRESTPRIGIHSLLSLIGASNQEPRLGASLAR